MKTSFGLVSRLGAPLAIFCSLFASPAARAQTSAAAPQQAIVYDVAKETRVQGTIQQIDSSGAHLPVGTHIMVQTSEGLVDAHLGALTKASLDSLNLSIGDSVTLTGMTETTSNGSVYLVRILSTSLRVVILRNERGFPVKSLLPRGTFSSSAMLKGGL